MAMSPLQLKSNHWTWIQFELKYLKQFDSFEIKKGVLFLFGIRNEIFENRNKKKSESSIHGNKHTLRVSLFLFFRDTYRYY